MLVNIILLGFVLFSILQFIKAIEFALESPVLVIVGIFSLILVNGAFMLIKGIREVTVIKDSIIGKVASSSRQIKVLVVSILWLLSIGNFIYASRWIGTPITRGAEYIEAVIIAFMAFVIITSNQKNRP